MGFGAIMEHPAGSYGGREARHLQLSENALDTRCRRVENKVNEETRAGLSLGVSTPEKASKLEV
jgi:hypothetical protein